MTNRNNTTYTVNDRYQVTYDGVNSYTYDAYGNRTYKTWSGGWLQYTWDDENRLLRVETDSSGTPESYRWRTEFVYDGRGRLRVRQDYTWQYGGWYGPTGQRYFLYDGLLLLQERVSTTVPQVTYARGLDLRGTLEGAGGIGGLLARYRHATGSSYGINWASFYHADGNGNVTYLANSTGGTDAAYRYDPFGRRLAGTGPYAAVNVMRFSSKPWIAHIGSNSDGLYYYGYRFYDPNTQRWPNRDPLGDIGSLAHLSAHFEPFAEPSIDVSAAVGPFETWGGANLYAYVENNPINFIDPFGLTSIHAQVGVAIAKGDVAALEALLGTGQLSAAQTAMVQAALSKYRSTAVQWIAKNCKGTIAREFPSEFYNTTLGTIRQLAQQGNKAAQKAWKLLNKGEYKK